MVEMNLIAVPKSPEMNEVFDSLSSEYSRSNSTVDYTITLKNFPNLNDCTLENFSVYLAKQFQYSYDRAEKYPNILANYSTGKDFTDRPIHIFIAVCLKLKNSKIHYEEKSKFRKTAREMCMQQYSVQIRKNKTLPQTQERLR
jgi:hypothetical protein